MKITRCHGLADGGGQLAKGLGHEARLKAHVGIAHFALDFGPRHQGGHRVDHHHIDGPAAHQHVGNFQGLFAGIRLGNQQFVAVDTQLAGVHRCPGHVRRR
jgi:hypothetical protein